MLFGVYFILVLTLDILNSQLHNFQKILLEQSQHQSLLSLDYLINSILFAKPYIKLKTVLRKLKDYLEVDLELWLLDQHLFRLKFYRSLRRYYNVMSVKVMGKHKQPQLLSLLIKVIQIMDMLEALTE